ncbi:MAG: hypothetical protein IPL32_12240 [Chloracidobacterium sp.]|nr:hypothetical protein [Chloracidobacterium sp.]
MLVFVLIGLSLVLVGVVGLQFTYMYYVERMYSERRKHMQALERRAEDLKTELETARKHLFEQNELLKTAYSETRKPEEVWADVIEER